MISNSVKCNGYVVENVYEVFLPRVHISTMSLLFTCFAVAATIFSVNNDEYDRLMPPPTQTLVSICPLHLTEFEIVCNLVHNILLVLILFHYFLKLVIRPTIQSIQPHSMMHHRHLASTKLPFVWQKQCTSTTSSSAIAEKPRNALCPSVFSVNESFIIVRLRVWFTTPRTSAFLTSDTRLCLSRLVPSGAFANKGKKGKS